MRQIAIIVLTVALTTLAFVLYYPYSPGGRQRRDMEAARQHIPKVEALLKNDPRFRHVNAFVYTGEGSLAIGGFVKSDQDLADLKQLVSSTSPPVGVSFFTKVYPSPIYEEMEKATDQP